MKNLSSPNAPRFIFEPCCRGWIALHPKPQGVIQFIGSAQFDAFPTVSYRYFLTSFFNAGYTVVVFPCRFTLDHWSITLEFLARHYTVRRVMLEAAITQGYDPTVYLDPANYAWMAHGLGGKYVALLEVLSSPIDILTGAFKRLNQESQPLQRIQQALIPIETGLRQLEKRIQQLTGYRLDYGQPTIIHQVSILLAPMITDLNGAVPLKPLQQVVSNLITVYPTVEQTYQLIEDSPLFHLTGLIQFSRDYTAAYSCQQLMQAQPRIRRRFLKGSHLEAVGMRMGQLIVDFNPLDKLVQPLQNRDLEGQVLTLLHRLRDQPIASSCQPGMEPRVRRRRAIAA